MKAIVETKSKKVEFPNKIIDFGSQCYTLHNAQIVNESNFSVG